MERTLQGNGRMTNRINHIGTLKGLWWGLIGGLAGTMVMDLVLVGGLSALGLPTNTCFLSFHNILSFAFLCTSHSTDPVTHLASNP